MHGDERVHATDPEIIESRSEVVTRDCRGGERVRGDGYVNRDGNAYAACFTSCNSSDGEIWIDVVLGTWGNWGLFRPRHLRLPLWTDRGISAANVFAGCHRQCRR